MPAVFTFQVPRLHALILSAALLALGLTGASAQTPMRCSHQLPPTHAIAGVIDRWAERVEELSGGEIDVQVFGAASLVGPNENIVAVARGEIECAFSVNFQWGRTLPIMNVTIAPYAFSDMAIWRNWHDSDAAAFLNERIAERGLVNVAWLFQTNSSVFTSRGRLLVMPEDFNGMKIRATGGRVLLDLLGKFGASSISLPAPEMGPALAQGAIDGALTSAGGWEMVGTDTVPYASLVPGLNMLSYAVLVDQAWLDGLPEDIRQTIEDTTKEFVRTNWPTAKRLDQEALDAIIARGGQFSTVGDAEREEFVNAAQAITEAWRERHPEAWEEFQNTLAPFR